MLIGDAAHVFPPFGAQGIANGIRDALSLSWRIGHLLNTSTLPTDAVWTKTLNLWSTERRLGVNQASVITMNNGNLMRNKSWALATVTSYINSVLKYPFIRNNFFPWALSDAQGYQKSSMGFFLADCRGGGKMAQVWVHDSGDLVLSDKLFWSPQSALTLLIVNQDLDARELNELNGKLKRFTEVMVVSPTIVAVTTAPSKLAPADNVTHVRQTSVATVMDLKQKGIQPIENYDPSGLFKRFSARCRYALVRSDLIIYSEASTAAEVENQLQAAEKMLLSA
jgi:hypothetical protein